MENLSGQRKFLALHSVTGIFTVLRRFSSRHLENITENSAFATSFTISHRPTHYKLQNDGKVHAQWCLYSSKTEALPATSKNSKTIV